MTRHNSAKEHAENAAAHADAAVRVMNEGELPQFRDRAFEELGFAVLELSRAVAKLADR